MRHEISNFIYFSIVVGGGGYVLVRGLILWRKVWQGQVDSSRMTYKIKFPRDLKFDRSALLITSLGGLKTHDSKTHLGPKKTLALEVVATQESIEWLISFPKMFRVDVESSLQGTIPGIGFEEVTPTHHDLPWTLACRLSARKANIDPDPDLVEGLLRSFTGLKKDECVVSQIIFEPAPHEVYRDDEEQEYPACCFVTVRLAARAAVERRAEEILGPIARKYGSLQIFAPRNAELVNDTKRILKPHYGRIDWVNEQATPHAWDGAITNKAVAVAWVMPINTPQMREVGLGGLRQFPPDNIVASVGFKIGQSLSSGAPQTIALNPNDMMTQVDIVGKIGSGKSSVMGSLILQEIEAGHGVGVLDPHDDLLDFVLARMPKNRIDDVILVEPILEDMAVPFNILESAESPEAIADTISGVFRGIYGETSAGVMNEMYLGAAIQTLASVPGMTLMDVPHFLTNKEFRARVVDQVDDLYLTNQWEDYDRLGSKQSAAADPGLRRIEPLRRRAGIRRMLGQSDNTLDMRRLIRERKIVMMHLPERLGKGTYDFIGSVFFKALWSAAVSVAKDERTPFYLSMDEAHFFMKGGGLGSMLDQSRKYGLSFTMAHQGLGQVPPEMRDAIMRSTRTKISFQVAYNDAQMLAKEFGESVVATDLTSLNKREFLVKTVNNEQTTATIAVRSFDWASEINDPAKVRERARRNWAKPARVIETEMITRQRGKAVRDPDKPLVVGWEDEKPNEN